MNVFYDNPHQYNYNIKTKQHVNMLSILISLLQTFLTNRASISESHSGEVWSKLHGFLTISVQYCNR